MKKQNGFTIIEVVLVLGIAGLIFLMFLIALPALNALQRDSAREENISKLIEYLKRYQTNSRGALPTDFGANGTFYNDYLNANFVDPGGEPYQFVLSSCEGTIVDGECGNNITRNNMQELSESTYPNDWKVYIVKQAKCANDGSEMLVVANSNKRKFAVLQRLERGGVYCEDA